jgi:hypothetical protein
MKRPAYFWMSVLLLVGFDVFLWLLRGASAPAIGKVSLFFAVLAQIAGLAWLGWLFRKGSDGLLRPLALVVMLIGAYWALWAVHYSGCRRIHLFGSGACALPRTASIAQSPRLADGWAAPNNSFKPKPLRGSA